MRSFETSGLFGRGRNRESLCLNLSVSGRVLVLGLGLGLGFGLVVPQVAWAACVATPNCASLGYTATSCVSGGVKCPWDTSKLFCGGCGADFVYSCTGTGYSGGAGIGCNGKYTSCNCASGYFWGGESCCESTYQHICTGTGYSGGSGTACGGKYTACTCADGYEWSGSGCALVCSVGKILFSDMSCSTGLVSGKMPIGVVSYVNGSKRIAIQLDAPSRMYWSNSYTDISGIPNYTDFTSPKTDFSGKSNTQAWVNYYDTSVTGYAPGYCYSYSTTGTSAGDWYLPAVGELYASVWKNKSSVNAGLSKAGGTAIVEGYHWSSSENTSNGAWYVYAPDGNVDWYGKPKLASLCVRCVLAF